MTDFLPRAPLPDEDEDQVSNLPAVAGNNQVATQVTIAQTVEIRRAALSVPRDQGKVRRQIREMAEWSEGTWEYEYEMGGELINGATVQCAHAVWNAWGNCTLLEGNQIEETPEAWHVSSTFMDHETGATLVRAFRQRKSQRTGKFKDPGRGMDIAFLIGVSKSGRNVVVNALGTVVAYARRCARNALVKQIKEDPQTYRDRIKDRLQAVDYPLVKLEAWANAKIDKWEPAQIAQVVRILTAHADGALGDLDTVFAPRGVDVDGAAKKPNGGAEVASGRAAPAEAAPTATTTAVRETVDPKTGEVTEATPARKPRIPKPDKDIMVLGRPFKTYGTAVNEIGRVVEREPIGVLVDGEDEIRALMDEFQKKGFLMEALRATLEARYAAETDNQVDSDDGDAETADEGRTEYGDWLDGMSDRFSKAFPEALVRMVGEAKDEAARFGDEERTAAYAAIDAAAQARRDAIASENRVRAAAEQDDANKLG